MPKESKMDRMNSGWLAFFMNFLLGVPTWKTLSVDLFGKHRTIYSIALWRSLKHPEFVAFVWASQHCLPLLSTFVHNVSILFGYLRFNLFFYASSVYLDLAYTPLVSSLLTGTTTTTLELVNKTTFIDLRTSTCSSYRLQLSLKLKPYTQTHITCVIVVIEKKDTLDYN